MRKKPLDHILLRDGITCDFDMRFANYIKEIAKPERHTHPLTPDQAYRLYSAMLDGGVPDMELGGILLALHMKNESLAELCSFYRAVQQRLYCLVPTTDNVRTVVIPTYNGARNHANLLPLVALLLARFRVPVLIHGTLDGHGRIASAYIFRELGIMPCLSLDQAQQHLHTEGLAFVPTAVLSPGLNNLLALRNRLGVRNTAHILVNLIDPMGGEGLCVANGENAEQVAVLRGFFQATQRNAVLLRGTEGEAFANPTRRPQLEYLNKGVSEVLFEAEANPQRVLSYLPQSTAAPATALWIKQVLKGDVPLPLPIANQLATLLYASAYTEDINQAKAIVALETNCLAVA